MLLFYPYFRQKSVIASFVACNVTKCILMVLCLTACTAPSIYYDKNFNPPVYFGTHVVQKNETLYSIAWRYGRDFKELAAANNIRAPYRILVGQKINLELSAEARSALRKKRTDSSSSERNVTARNQSNKTVNKTIKKKIPNNSKDITWGWPHLGLILAKYSAPDRTRIANKGIDISGSEGDAIKSAASGEVVYAGNGLLGYGNLIIINHSDRYLSAYGHNKDILVREGQTVKLGQVIAKMGRNGLKPMLHFEIRKDGEPVNPEIYLPHR